MENFYTAYLKTINGVTFYFVKQYRIFPEYKNVEPILEKYAMHTDFEKACNIAMIFDQEIQQQLLEKLQIRSAEKLAPAKAEIFKFKAPQINFLSILKLMGLNKAT